jgi:hypothetical protein
MIYLENKFTFTIISVAYAIDPNVNSLLNLHSKIIFYNLIEFLIIETIQNLISRTLLSVKLFKSLSLNPIHWGIFNSTKHMLKLSYKV